MYITPTLFLEVSMSQDFVSQRLRNLALFGFLIFIGLMLCSLFLPDRNAFSAQVTLSWTAPTTNTDGTSLRDLAGYKAYYGTASRTYSTATDVGKVTNCQITNLRDGQTYYFAVTAYDTSGNESAYSNEVSKTVSSSGQQFTLTITKSGTGTGTVTAGSGINCGSTCKSSYNKGTIVTLTATPAAGSAFAGWTGGCTGTGQCSMTINADTTVTAAFNLARSFTITASAGSGGSISPSGTVTVTKGSDQDFTITPNNGYRISDVAVDSSSVGAVSSYTFSDVTASHTIQASFAARRWWR
jgi:Divergent InlB B-repeat domain/Fibronectin type III domain